MKRLAPLVLLALSPCQGLAFQSVYVIRHAEKLDASRDPELSPQGKARAHTLAKTLRESGITKIFTSEYKRTIQTAAPLAEALKLKLVSTNDIAKTLKALKDDTSQDSALVIGHSNTVPELIKGLGSELKVEIAESQFDRMYIVNPQKGAKPTVSLIHY